MNTETIEITSNTTTENSHPATSNATSVASPESSDQTNSSLPTHPSSLLESLVKTLERHVILPPHAAEALALWILHTYAFHLRDVSTYLGIESPEKRCGKTTLLTVLSELCNRAIVASNISSPAFFRVIEETRPTLLIDEADTFLQGNDELRGILNSGYSRKTAYVVRVTNQPSNPQSEICNPQSASQSSNSQSAVGAGTSGRNPQLIPLSPSLATFSTWCPKAIAAIGHLPDTLSDRCIVIRMQRKTNQEPTQRLRHLQTNDLRQQCEAFVATHANAIANAQPEIPNQLNDRAADIWEPLLVLADIVGGDWPQKARTAAIALSTRATESNPIGALFLDILLCFTTNKSDRVHTRTILEYLQQRGMRPWNETLKKPINDLWLAQQLRPYGIRPRSTRIAGVQAKGYYQSDMLDAFRRYVPESEINRVREEIGMNEEEPKP